MNNPFDAFLTTTWEDADRNLLKIPVTWMDPSKDNAESWTYAYRATLDYGPVIPTLSGGISKDPMNFRYYRTLLDVTRNSISLYIIEPDNCYALRFRDAFKKESETGDESLSGAVAFSLFRRFLKREGFDISDLAITNGSEVKATIAQPDIRLNPDYKDVIVEHAFHVDINSAYFAGINKKFGHCGDGVMGYVINHVYEHRNDGTPSSKYNKSILNCTQGFGQSQWCILKAPGEERAKGYALSHLAKAGIEDCKATLAQIIKRYEKKGCRLVATNTDGAWFAPTLGHELDREFLEDVPGYGHALGEFKIDHFDCLLRYRSKGAYEYFEDGKYHPVIRGRTHLDYLKARPDWEWGDIYHQQARVVKYRFFEKDGIYMI